MANMSFNGFDKWTEEQAKDRWLKIVSVMKRNQLGAKKTRSTLLRGNDFSRYRAKFDTKKLKPQITRSYGSLKGGLIGAINGFENKNEDWRMLNVLLHDRQLHQRYGRTLVPKTHTLDGSTNKLRRELRRLK